MKKKVPFIIIILALLICGCSMGKTEHYPEYFAPIVQELETSWEDITSPYIMPFIMDKWWDEGALWKGKYEEKAYTVTIDEKVFTFDLKDELTSAEEWNWFEVGAISDKVEDKTYICLSDFTIMYEEGKEQYPQFLLIEFPTQNPEDYQVLPYAVEPYDMFGWEAYCYTLGESNNIYFRSRDGLAAIDLGTKQLHYFWDESSHAKEYAEKIFGEPYHNYFFAATFELDGVTVFSAEVSEANDIPAIGAVFVAYRDHKPIANMWVDFRAESMKDGIKIEVLN